MDYSVNTCGLWHCPTILIRVCVSQCKLMPNNFHPLCCSMQFIILYFFISLTIERVNYSNVCFKCLENLSYTNSHALLSTHSTAAACSSSLVTDREPTEHVMWQHGLIMLLVLDHRKEPFLWLQRHHTLCLPVRHHTHTHTQYRRIACVELGIFIICCRCSVFLDPPLIFLACDLSV